MKAGIIGAMDEEIEKIKSMMFPVRELEFSGFKFYSGVLEGVKVVLLKSGIGKVNAAIGTTLLIIYHEPNCIINTGSAGGFSGDLNIGDVVISNEVMHHDVDVTAFGYDYGQIPRMPSRYLPSSALVDIAKKSVNKIRGVKLVDGLIASGDSFMNDPHRIDELKVKMPNVKVAEMEAAAVAQTCHHFGKNFVIIRSVSDIAGVESPYNFQEYLNTAAINSSSIVLEILKELKVYENENERRTPESITRRMVAEREHENNIRTCFGI